MSNQTVFCTGSDFTQEEVLGETKLKLINGQLHALYLYAPHTN